MPTVFSTISALKGGGQKGFWPAIGCLWPGWPPSGSASAPRSAPVIDIYAVRGDRGTGPPFSLALYERVPELLKWPKIARKISFDSSEGPVTRSEDSFVAQRPLSRAQGPFHVLIEPFGSSRGPFMSSEGLITRS